ncbi:anaphase-promoting complex subunit 10 [Pyrus ussuriensis x Pyrus communis]|uniref:Anaphase-promoting complex subunit 10 n=1 Tax=Pyrus ussuriensis x Pyrus communis TaxID=2448454 RepID=A0A5N5G513_9ROSA|nr:anaphase-promoting complex subunit 10 [Pyrus ussuriensis x Pyrus communis]
MATESSEGEEDAKLTGGNQLLVVDDDLREMGKKAAWSVSSCKAGNGVSSLRDDNLDTYWQSDGAQPHLVNVQFQRKVQLLIKYRLTYIFFLLVTQYLVCKYEKVSSLFFYSIIYVSLNSNCKTFHHGNHRDGHPRRGPWHHYHGPSRKLIPRHPYRFTLQCERIN